MRPIDPQLRKSTPARRARRRHEPRAASGRTPDARAPARARAVVARAATGRAVRERPRPPTPPSNYCALPRLEATKTPEAPGPSRPR